MSQLTHLDSDGRPRMVDVGGKPLTDRVAVAEAYVSMSAEARAAIAGGEVKKGNVLRIAELAGVQGCKRTSDLIPLCHPMPIDGVVVTAELSEAGVHIQATVRAHWKTGVEMEALTAVTAAALTVYDCTKAIDKSMVIHTVRLLAKQGGRSGEYRVSVR
jgi:cyclic pyranopterin monophosphate synthase